MSGVARPPLPHGMHFFERGWLSCNNLLLTHHGTSEGEPAEAVLIDTSHVNHAAQTVALVRHTLHSVGAGQSLKRVLNTHLHSDHCGGNAALQAEWPGLPVDIPPGCFAAAANWDESALSFQATGQRCQRFAPRRALRPGSEEVLAGRRWQVHAAPGHDPHSLILFEPASRVLMSADALWGNGFGVVFPELDGQDAFAEVSDTLDLIESLAPQIVLPGHGPAFMDVDAALARARRRLDGFVQSPEKHRRHALKVLLKYHLLEVQREPLPELLAWVMQTPLLLRQLHDSGTRHEEIRTLLHELAASGAAKLEGGWVQDA